MPGLVLAAALVVYPVLEPSSLRGLFVFVGLIGVGLLAVAAATAAPGVVALGVLVLFAEYAASLVADEGVDWGAPVYGAALLLLGEIAYGLAGRHRGGAGDAARAPVVAAVGVASGFAVLGLAAVPLPHGAFVQALGAGVATAVLLGLAALARPRAG